MTGAPARLYVGHVMHLRLRPKRHGFRYRVWTLLADIDRLAELRAGSRLLRSGLVSVSLRDHGPRDGSPLRPWVEGELARAGLPVPARIEMLAMPRILGHVFNPLTVYFCTDAAGRLESLVYEVKNTFGDQVAYALPAGEERGGLFEQVQAKEMFVSPFIDMAQRYRFRIGRPGDRLAVMIRETGPEGEVLIATQSGRAEAFSDARLALRLLSHPLLTLKVVAGIHWEALRLFLKGVRFLGHPGAGRVFAGAAARRQSG